MLLFNKFAHLNNNIDTVKHRQMYFYKNGFLSFFCPNNTLNFKLPHYLRQIIIRIQRHILDIKLKAIEYIKFP